MDAILEREIHRTLDYRKIRKLASRYSWMFDGGRCKEIVELYAKKTSGVRAEMLWGVYDGPAGIRKLYAGFYKSLMGEPLISGQMFAEINGGYDIVVAGDGKTAKGICEYMGSETHAFSGKLQAYWTYGKRAFDFVKEDGEWRIWHYHVYGNWYTPYEKGWVEGNKFPDYPGIDKYPPDRPPTTGEREISVGGVGPVSPMPYETFDEKTAY